MQHLLIKYLRELKANSEIKIVNRSILISSSYYGKIEIERS